MLERYLDVMERALFAYTPEKVRAYIDRVRREGLREHGFPRLGVCMGVLLAHGRRQDLREIFLEIMDICCTEMPLHKANNDFTVREVCVCLMLLEEKGLLDPALLARWRESLSRFDPWTRYNKVASSPEDRPGNWALFAALSEFVRGIFCKTDTAAFVEWQLATQVDAFDENGMYRDPDDPMVYDLVPRVLFLFLLRFGYRGRYADRVRKALDRGTDLTLMMQSVTGEIPFGGRSNQFLHNEALLVSYFELEALRRADGGDLKRASLCRGAAALALENLNRYLSRKPVRHIKNRYDLSTRVGCEDYGYFDKYMITTATNLFYGALFASDEIPAAAPPAETGGFAFSLGSAFHKTFQNAGGYFLEWETNADFHYDANGLGRVQKKGCSPVVCVAVPFPRDARYVLERENPAPLSLCPFMEREGKRLLGSAPGVAYRLLHSGCENGAAVVRFEVVLAKGAAVKLTSAVSGSGVDLTLDAAGDAGFMIPVFAFDGAGETEIREGEKEIEVRYDHSFCRYTFDGDLSLDYALCCNRNGRYRVYAVKGGRLHIEMGGEK